MRHLDHQKRRKIVTIFVTMQVWLWVISSIVIMLYVVMTLMDQKIVIECVLNLFFFLFNSVSRYYRFSDGIRLKIYVDETTDDIPERIRNMRDEEEHNQFIVKSGSFPCPCRTTLTIEKKSKRVLESGRLSFLDSGEDKNGNESLSNNLDQKWGYTTKIMMEEFSESWRSVLKYVFPFISEECSFFTQKRFTTTKNLTVRKCLRKCLMKVSVRVNQISIFISYIQKSEQNIISSNTDFIISYELTTKFTEHEIWDFNCIVQRNQSLCITKSFSGIKVSSSVSYQKTVRNSVQDWDIPQGTRSVIEFERKGRTSHSLRIFTHTWWS